MTKPAARIADLHTCPAANPNPHVGGPILPPASLNVLIANLAAGRATDTAMCVGPVDFIVVGSATVSVNNKMAAYMGSQTMHGGVVSIGAPNVMVGGPPAGATLGNPAGAVAVFPGAQSFGNCGIQSAQQVIHQATGNNMGENALLNWALANNHADNDANPDLRGATTASQTEDILDAQGVPSDVQPGNMDNIQQTVAEGRGVISGNDAGVLWNSANPADHGSGHAVLVTGLRYDSNGQLESVIINDTGNGNSADAIPAARFQNSLLAGDDITVTDAPVF